MLTRADIPIAE